MSDGGARTGQAGGAAGGEQAVQERTLLEGVGAVRLARDVVAVEGVEAAAFLQGQLSQDLDALAEGASAWSFLLQPQGKVDALVRVTRTGPERLLVDVDGGWGEAVRARLDRFRLRVKAELRLLGWGCVALRGPGSATVDLAGPGPDHGRVVVDASWPGLAGCDLLGPAPDVPAGVPECGPAAWAAVRILAGVPAMGAELDERTIPAESGLVERTVSFTKGCYTGQELVARIDSRGHVNRHLRRLVVDGGPVPDVGATVVGDGGREVGRVTSSAWSASRAAGVALAYVRREVEVPAEVTVSWPGGDARAQATAVPA